MRFTGPIPTVLLIHIPTQMEVRLVTEEKTVQEMSYSQYGHLLLVKLVVFCFANLSLCLKNQHLCMETVLHRCELFGACIYCRYLLAVIAV